MAPKRSRASTSQAASQYDTTRFVSQEASDKFHRVLANKSLVPERGFRPDARLDGQLFGMIADMEWTGFTRPPPNAVVNVVREFYANATTEGELVSRVRGKRVPWDRKAINALCGAPDYESGPYQTNRMRDCDLDEIIRKLCRPGTTWKTNIYSGEKVSFAQTELSRYGKAWYSFICSNVMPTRHLSDVTKERAVLLFAIVTGVKVDVGLIIQESILKTLKGSTSGGLPYPSLITSLCAHVNVRWREDEIVMPPMINIDHHTIQRFKDWDGAQPHPRGEGYLPALEPPPSSEAGPSAPAPPMDASVGPMADILASLNLLHTKVDRTTRRVDVVAQRQNLMMQFQAEFATTVAGIYASSGGDEDMEMPFQFPAPPVYPPYPPPSPVIDPNEPGEEQDDDSDGGGDGDDGTDGDDME